MLCEVLSSDELDFMRSVLGNAEECLSLEPLMSCLPKQDGPSIDRFFSLSVLIFCFLREDIDRFVTNIN